MRDFDISHQGAKQITQKDCERTNAMPAMDDTHFRFLHQNLPAQASAELYPLLQFVPQVGSRELPDLFHSDIEDFFFSMELIDARCAGLVDELRRAIHN